MKPQIHSKIHDQFSAMTANLESVASSQMKTEKRCFIGQRHVVTLLAFFGCFFVSTNRLVLSVGIVGMVKHGQKNETVKWNTSEVSCPIPSAPSKPVSVSNVEGEFDWSTELQGYLLGAGFLSCTMIQTPAGRLIDAVGSKFLLVSSNALAGILIIMSPLAANWDVYALMAVQFLRGAAQGVTNPAIFKMMSNWIPRSERGTLNSFSVCGFSVGIAVGGTVTGWLCDIPGLGWPYAFYIWGTICVLYAFVTYFAYYEHPAKNPWITDEELKYITDGFETKRSEMKFPTPWGKMFASPPTYAYLYGYFGHMWAVAYFLTVHPNFMATVLHYSTAASGLASCLPVLLATLGGVVASIISHWVSKKNWISLNNLRKITTGVSAFGFSLCTVGILLVGCDAIVNILCFALSLFSMGIAIAGIMISGVDMAPAFAGSLIGVAYTVGGIAIFLVPVITGLLTSHETLSEWNIVFWINLAIVGSSGVLYVLFGSAEVQPWNYREGELPNEAPNEGRRQEDKNPNQPIELRKNLENYNS